MKLKISIFLTLLILLIGSLAVRPSRAASTLHVKPDGSGDCSNWDDACDLTTALGSAAAGDEVWVTGGLYKPTIDSSDRTATFHLKDEVALYGGFAGTETEREQRDFVTNVTVLSGDIDNNDIVGPNDVVITTTNIIGNNAYHVVTSSGVSETAILDGFTITAGQANDEETNNDNGGGMYNYYGNLTLNHITFSGNFANVGGGMYNTGSNSTLTNVTFSGNFANVGGGMYNTGSNPTLTNVTFSGNTADRIGGGMYNYYGNPTLTNVTFNDNFASNGGGGMFSSDSNPTLTNVTFNDNFASNSGGGMYNSRSNPTLTNVTFNGNTANSNYAGGMYNASSSLTLTHVTLSGNSAHHGGGMYNYNSSPTLTNITISDNFANHGGGMYNYYGNPTLTNATFSNNTANDGGGGGMYNARSSPTLTSVTFSDNTAGNGGGMYNDNNSPTLTNVTFSDNFSHHGGGMYNYYGNPTLTNVTFSGNIATRSGGGIRNDENSNPVVSNTLFTQGLDGNNCYGNLFATGSINNLADDESCDTASTTYSPGLSTTLGTLGNYGGNTLTVPLLEGSPAIDTEDTPSCPTTDQRGAIRSDGLCDAGAFEYEAMIPTTITLATAPNPSIYKQSLTFTATVTAFGSPTGEVTFYNDGTALGTDMLDGNGVVTYTTTTLPAGTHIITATYHGDLYYESGTSDGISQTVRAPLHPIANAGADQIVFVNSIVTLDGSDSSDPNAGDTLTYFWQQTDGPMVTVSDATAISPTFIAPSAATVLTFTLTVSDTDGLSDSDQVVITVESEPDNQAPVATSDNYTMSAMIPLHVAAPGVLSNDSDPDNDPLTAVLDTNVLTGTLELDSDGSFTYTAPPSYTGIVTFNYHANDGIADSNVVQVMITVQDGASGHFIFLPLIGKG